MRVGSWLRRRASTDTHAPGSAGVVDLRPRAVALDLRQAPDGLDLRHAPDALDLRDRPVVERPVVRLHPVSDGTLLTEAAGGLHRRSPELSAADTLSAPQQGVAVFVAMVVAAGLAVAPRWVATALVGIAIAYYAAAVVFRTVLVRRSLLAPAVLTVDDEAARAIPDHELPHYTVLIPLYREPELAPRLGEILARLDYPRDRLDIKVLLEADDVETIDAVRRAPGDIALELVVVPVMEPRTKPKACNVGLALARGELVTIYDAEDEPDVLQLRRAAAAFLADPGLACVQAHLSYYNASQNLLTRWFTAEYDMWFHMYLPGLGSLDAPLPLGGTSNHIRRSVLEDLGGWDAHNVTEDADLGVRLRRAGHRVQVLGSTTLEEANSDVINWVKQRSRWYKGYLQTWLVHLRSPRRLWREVGPTGFASHTLFVGGTPILTALNPLFWVMTLLWFLQQPAFVRELFPAAVYYVAVGCWFFGNLSVVYWHLLGVRVAGHERLAAAALITPLYWLLMSAAAIKAVVQLAVAPTYWEKTTHGLDVTPPQPVPVLERSPA